MPTGKRKHCHVSYVSYHQTLQEYTLGLVQRHTIHILPLHTHTSPPKPKAILDDIWHQYNITCCLVERVVQWREPSHKGSTRFGHLPTKDRVLNSTGTFSSGR
ncbi:hypothetical protein PAMP_015669 [Pampus punctatissimus]